MAGSLTNSGLNYHFAPRRYRFLVPRFRMDLDIKSCSRVSSRICRIRNPTSVFANRVNVREFRYFKSVELDRFVTSDDENEMSEGFFEAIEELERMAREPSDVLEEMNDRLTARELQLVLVYFSQEGRDSWCALEVFEWLRKENRVDKETMELMVSIMCGWVKKLIDRGNEVGEVVDLLVDMDCVGLKPSFSMIEKVISLYWEMGERDGAVLFVKEVLRRGIAYSDDDGQGKKGGPTGYLAWKMMDIQERTCNSSFANPTTTTSQVVMSGGIFVLRLTAVVLVLLPEVSPNEFEEEGNYRDAVKLVVRFRESGLKPEVYSYLIAMTAVVKELNEFAKALRKLKGFTKAGSIIELDLENVGLIEEYQSDLLADGVRMSNWVIEEGGSSLYGVVYERLLAMYICAGRGLQAERQLWEMKLMGKEADQNLYDIVLAICASQKEVVAIARLLTRMEVTSLLSKKKTLSWLLRGYIKGGHFCDAAETVEKMLNMGLCPDFLDRAAVLQGLRKRIQQSGNVETYLNLCKNLSNASLIGPCLVYLYIKKYKLWVVKMV
ncbi:hypothetical protein RJ639_003721 [Escallonia herrerae]|uniref:Pentatricopeptide repeat-containing protein n=1 Tax=Escallonia herrerae TaxID=1293975 RepID=A0AA88W3E3_9ASTE|nr:hypothetical protein RJ639_003721 [Escallonia herrerae]